MTRDLIKSELVVLRKVYGLDREGFSALLTEHLKARGASFVVTTEVLKRWEEGIGPSDRPRKFLEPTLIFFRQSLQPETSPTTGEGESDASPDAGRPGASQ